MPTGYTCFIEDGKVTKAKDFLNICLRNFGVLYFMRDDSLSQCNDYTEAIRKDAQDSIDDSQKEVDRLKKELEDFRNASDEVLYEKYVKSTQERRKRCEDRLQTIRDNNQKYQNILDELKGWVCSNEISVNVRKFAIDQIEMSMETTKYAEENLADIKDPSPEGFEKYKKDQIIDFEYDIKFYESTIEKIKVHLKERLELYEKFKEDLKKLEEK